MTLQLGPKLALPDDAVTQTFAILAKREEGWPWAAGLFEGEGCIDLHPERYTRRLNVHMTDLDVLQTFRAVVGAGTILERKVTGNRRRCWGWQVSRWTDVERIGRSLLPYLHGRRRAKMEQLLSSPPAKGLSTCPAGHPLFGPDADAYHRKGSARPICAVCTRARQRAYHRRIRRAA